MNLSISREVLSTEHRASRRYAAAYVSSHGREYLVSASVASAPYAHRTPRKKLQSKLGRINKYDSKSIIWSWSALVAIQKSFIPKKKKYLIYIPCCSLKCYVNDSTNPINFFTAYLWCSVCNFNSPHILLFAYVRRNFWWRCLLDFLGFRCASLLFPHDW